VSSDLWALRFLSRFRRQCPGLRFRAQWKRGKWGRKWEPIPAGQGRWRV